MWRQRKAAWRQRKAAWRRLCGSVETEEGSVETEEGSVETEEGSVEKGSVETEEGYVETEEAMFVATYKYLLATDESSERYPVCLCTCCDLWYHSTCVNTPKEAWGKNSIWLCSTCN